jgi:hypothetical protein
MMKNIQNFIAQGAVDTTYRELFAET